jgi:hypothetical protein
LVINEALVNSADCEQSQAGAEPLSSCLGESYGNDGFLWILHVVCHGNCLFTMENCFFTYHLPLKMLFQMPVGCRKIEFQQAGDPPGC